jgi:hypothetical protein
MGQLVDASGKTTDQILDSLQKALDDMKKKAAAQDTAAAKLGKLSIAPPKVEKREEQQPAMDITKKLAELAAKADFSGVGAGTIQLTFGKEDAGPIFRDVEGGHEGKSTWDRACARKDHEKRGPEAHHSDRYGDACGSRR